MSARIRTLIADDEPLARATVRTFLQGHPDLELVAETTTGLETAQALEALQPDLAFLDIAMPRGSGLDALKRHAPPAVVFVTAFAEFAARAFDGDAVDYLVKPFDRARFDRAVERARRRLGRPAAPGLPDRLAIRTGDRVTLVPVADVLAVEGADDYVTLHTATRTHLYSARLYELEAALDPALVRVHRSWLVRLAAVAELQSLRSGDALLTLDSGFIVRASRTHRAAWAVLRP